MALEIVCRRCGCVVKRYYDLMGQTVEQLLKELEGRRCPRCGHEFKGKLAGPITIKADR